jgi:hypothetical protein
MEFRIWIATPLDGRILEREVVSRPSGRHQESGPKRSV